MLDFITIYSTLQYTVIIGVFSPMFQDNTEGYSSSCHGDLGVKISVSIEMDL